jgi:predicted nucleotidyltransferase
MRRATFLRKKAYHIQFPSGSWQETNSPRYGDLAFLQLNYDVDVNNRIMLAIDIASSCGQAISMDEIALMLPVKKEPEIVRAILQTDPYFSKLITTRNDLAVLKGQERLLSERDVRKKVSEKYQRMAQTFADELVRLSRNIELIAVCGSAAYESATDSDDIDVFIIAKENRMWLAFFKALLLARVFRIKASINNEKADFCLSYMQDKKHFEEEIVQHYTPLFAREFLSLYVMKGKDYYKRLLRRAGWMNDVFPNLYSLKITKNGGDVMRCSQNLKRYKILDVSNLFFYVLLGSFLSFKAFMQNLRYRKQQKMKCLFETVITKGSSVYNSERYRDIEAKYDIKDPFRR